MTHTADNGGSAFPSEQGFDTDGMWNQSYDPGMSLRDYFAGQALAGNLGNPWASNSDDIAVRCYQIADAMLAARKGGAA